MMKEVELPFSTLHVDLDSLLDTRLSFLAFNKKISLKNKKDAILYFNRVLDEFPMMGFEEFKKEYPKRNKLVLKYAMGTHIHYLIKNFCASTLELPISTPWHMKPRICINTYPYHLTPEEESIIIQGMASSIVDLADIYIINLSNDELTPKFIKDNFSIVVKYDLMAWMDKYDNKEAFKEVRLPEVCFVGPMLFYKDPRQDKEFIKYVSEGSNPFADITRILKPLMTLMFLPAKHFSAVMKGLNDDQSILNEITKQNA